MAGINNGSLLSSAATILKTKQVNTGAVFGFLLSFPNFCIDDNEVLFALNINLSAIKEKSAMAKTQLIRKFFSLIIRSIFTSEISMMKTTLLAKKNGIIVNINVKKQRTILNQTVIIKKILMDMPKEIIVTVVFKFGNIKSIKVQLIGMWLKTVTSRDQFRALLFTLLVGTTAHDLGILLDRTGGKTCVINYSLNSGNWICCAVIGFGSEEDLESAYHTEPIFGGIKLFWARLDLVYYKRYRHFGHSVLECNVPMMTTSKSLKFVKKSILDKCHLQLAKLYTKKSVSISYSVAFGGKSWVQVVLLAFFSGGSYFIFGSGFGSSVHSVLSNKRSKLVVQNVSSINDYLVLLKHSLKLLADQVLDIVRKLNLVDLVPLASVSLLFSSAVVVLLSSDLDLNMILDISQMFPITSSSVVVNMFSTLSLSSSKIFTIKVGSLKLKLVALETSVGFKFATCNIKSINVFAKQKDIVCWHKKSENMIMNRFNEVWVFTSGLDVSFLDAGVAIIMDIFLACHVSKVEKIPGWLIFVHLLFKNKLSVTILGLYAGVSISICFTQAADVNSMISIAVSSSSFVVLGGDFNKNRSKKSVNFKFCLDLGLVNTFNEHLLAKALT
ncbi:hypothetical protein G9A89_003119 [Geosiphon pyriformis]|nr:hypothetical protein G9A89_003119 [Geosiphon pyriformis]